MVLGPISDWDYELSQREKERDTAARVIAKTKAAKPPTVASLNRLNSLGGYVLSDKKLTETLTAWRKDSEKKHINDDNGALSRSKISAAVDEIEKAQRIRADNGSKTQKGHKYASLTSKLTGAFKRRRSGGGSKPRSDVGMKKRGGHCNR